MGSETGRAPESEGPCGRLLDFPLRGAGSRARHPPLAAWALSSGSDPAPYLPLLVYLPGVLPALSTLAGACGPASSPTRGCGRGRRGVGERLLGRGRGRANAGEAVALALAADAPRPPETRGGAAEGRPGQPGRRRESRPSAPGAGAPATQLQLDTEV